MVLLARQMYESRDVSAMPILADALPRLLSDELRLKDADR
jgi:hypothetical protein